ncbi:MAG: sugar transferase [Deltaproteobacteria bacterium]|nr:sugar transferase [Deltaproteobacteria bacterium]
MITLLKLSDIFILSLTVLMTFWLEEDALGDGSLLGLLEFNVRILDLPILLCLVLSWHVTLSWGGMYRSKRFTDVKQEGFEIVRGVTLGTFVLGAVAAFCYPGLITATRISTFYAIAIVLTWSFRLGLRQALKRVRLAGRNLRNVMIVGSNKKAHDLAKRIEEEPELGYRVVGYVDSRRGEEWEGRRFLGTIDDLPSILKRHVIDEIIIALPVRSHYEVIQRVVEKAEEHGIIARYIYRLFNGNDTPMGDELLYEGPVSAVAFRPYGGPQLIAKRLMDIAISLIGLSVTLPITAVAAVLIKLESKGPIFFVQERVGYNKRVFKLFKFRTMVNDAEKMQTQLESGNEMDGPVFKIKADPRITKVGRWLRKTSIDEIPQLLNVLLGDMSVVGPRPLPMRDYRGFDEDWQCRRFSVLPGITCIWQVSGRNNLSFNEWMKMDMEYIDTWKLSLDFRILMKTIPAVVRGVGAS